MPSIVGNIKISSVGSSGVVLIGDTLQVSPESTNKSYGGSGSFNTGDFMTNNNAVSATNTWDSDVNDSNQSTFGNKGIV
ncbi:spore gernimation protein GerPA [Paenibacillus selenitireducens]|uniref:Spore gernimation protein GerPA n=1 Tax=Paenibacillus selenitireducens TaxID=1324314 RepID=A0A1T2XD74_9BACL|nr:spore germination protein [Paenibacillus selenitireducens]OPA77778.1 spore gernimation protein GerPA [Paenibacillus selenitireducens]